MSSAGAVLLRGGFTCHCAPASFEGGLGRQLVLADCKGDSTYECPCGLLGGV